MPAAQLAVHVRLDGPALDRKLTALRAMATQTGPLLAAIDPALYAEEVAEECFVEVPAVAPAEAPAEVPAEVPAASRRPSALLVP